MDMLFSYPKASDFIITKKLVTFYHREETRKDIIYDTNRGIDLPWWKSEFSTYTTHTG
ncbi:7209_t:CDS:2, partial [Ambispora leptoticha]